MSTNQAAWLTEAKGYPFQVSEAPMPTPGPHQMIVQTRAVAFNPADVRLQFGGPIELGGDLGTLCGGYPCVLGEDVAGDVVAVGDEVTRFQIGDRVTALAADVVFNQPFSGCFQLFCRVNDTLAAKVPEHVKYTDACVLPLGLCTAAGALFVPGTLELDFPRIEPSSSSSSPSVVVVWGASSSVGSCAVQMIRAAGYEVAATAGEKNQAYCKDLGAKWVFDYKSPTVVDDIVSALGGHMNAGVFCCVTDLDSVRACAKITDRLGGKRFVGSVIVPGLPVPEDLPAGVELGYSVSTYISNHPCGSAIWEQWLTPALANGSMKCKPEPEIVGQGLGKIQAGMDLMAKGVSAKKVVVEI